MSHFQRSEPDLEEITMEFHIPDSVVGVLMGRAKEKDSIMNYLRDTCYPAKIWIPFRERYGRSRKLIVMGWTQEVVDDAREIIYNFIKSETGNNISSLHPVFNQQDALEANWLNKIKKSCWSYLGSTST